MIVYFLTCACVDFFAAALPRLAALRGGGGSGNGGSSSGNAKTGKGGGSGGKGGGGGGNGGQPVAIHALHGRMKQAAREATLQKFAEGSSGKCSSCCTAHVLCLLRHGSSWSLQIRDPLDFAVLTRAF